MPASSNRQRPAHPEATVSLHWMIPFIRVTGESPNEQEILHREGITLADFINPDTRIRHGALLELFASALARLDMPTLGLLAGQRYEVGDMGPLEYAARSCANLRDSIHCCNRYMVLMHGALENTLVEKDDLAIWQFRITDGIPQPPAANDFAVSSAIFFARKHTAQRFPLRAVFLQHESPTDSAEYARVFDGAPVICGMQHNALLFDRTQLELPMAHANSGLQAAFELQTMELMRRLQRPEGVGAQVRRLLLERLCGGDISMPAIARAIELSGATLRRRLTDEQLSFSGLLEQVRHELAEKYLADPTLAISEVAFLLGFSHVSAFYRSFQRTAGGTTPAMLRARLQASHSIRGRAR